VQDEFPLELQDIMKPFKVMAQKQNMSVEKIYKQYDKNKNMLLSAIEFKPVFAYVM